MFDNIKAIIFDMDNTILYSKIDFKAMKRDIHQYLVKSGILPAELSAEGHTTSTMIEAARTSRFYSNKIHEELMKIAEMHEVAGMKDAELEPGAFKMLKSLSRSYRLTILTNNSYEAACKALTANGINAFFDHVAGREQACYLKPSPAGVEYLMGLYPYPAEGWLSIGDCWIDGHAAISAGAAFILYRGDPSNLKEKGVTPAMEIDRLEELLEFL